MSLGDLMGLFQKRKEREKVGLPPSWGLTSPFVNVTVVGTIGVVVKGVNRVSVKHSVRR